MKKIILIFCVSLLIVSCKNNTSEPSTKIDDGGILVPKDISPGLYSDPIIVGEFVGELLNEGDTIPDFTINKGQVDEWSLSDLRGRVVYIKFWRSNCSNCRVSIPFLVEKYKEINDEGFVVVTVTSDITEKVSLDKTAQFITEYKMNDWINIYDGETKKTSIFKNYSIFGTPNGYLINKKGIIVKRIYPHEESFISTVNQELYK
ncbi:MAG: hypothetical protein CVV25_04070 [Ignavibacteriae bacterium HGW-Ignavibacteriae-4]|jgi:peroxiredoxin|nr:MAG: hypothetical protein CVV25_04070 [Ignavibacteriae bacterium HGW-Ignavibacteriae-4]